MSKFTDLFGGLSKEELHEFSIKMLDKCEKQLQQAKIVTIETDDGEIIELDIDDEAANDN